MNRLDIAQTSSKLAMEEGKDNLGEQAVKAEQNLLALIQATVARLRGLSEATKIKA